MNAFRSEKKSRWLKFISFAVIIAAATLAGMYCFWQFPGLDLYGRDLLMRSRGTLPVPEDIVVVAIDEASIEKLGRFPWSRDLTANVIKNISEAKPKVIALNVLYAEPSDESDDEELANAIEKSGNVVVAEQLIEDRNNAGNSESVWLQTLPEIGKVSGGIGHVNVATEFDGTARELFLKLADDEGKTRWAIAFETVRFGKKIDNSQVIESDRSIKFGDQEIPFLANDETNFPYSSAGENGGIIINKPLRILVDYIGPTGSFAPRTYSFSDVLDGKIDASKFRDKYVLIGATAATLGDKIATPFTHFETANGGQNGELMPGVEILANSVNTILQKRFYQPVSDLTAAVFAALLAFLVLLLIRFSEGKYETLKKVFVLLGLLLLIPIGSYFVYVNFLILPPLVPMLTSFVVATPLALLQRSLTASAGIDARINELLEVQEKLLTSENNPTKEQKTGNFLPHGIEWKTRTLESLSRELITRSLFIDNSLRSLDEGLLIANVKGNITFANRKATEIFDISEVNLIGSNLLKIFNEVGNTEPQNFNKETLERVLIERENVSQEISFGEDELSYYEVNLSAVVSPDDADREPLGVVATLSDVTKHRELQKTKNDIITLVTHELRTPLTAIQGMSEVLSEHDVDAKAQKKMLDAINGESKRLARMINEYLDITQLEAGKQKIHFDSVNIKKLLEQTTFLLEPFATQHNIKIKNSVDNELPLIFGDAEMLEQAFTNLIANAVKYSPPETKVEIITQAGDKHLKISIKDEGTGISEEHLPRIFEKFYRVPKRQRVDVPGTGLGLALTKEIIELHGGRIEVESTENVGSVFTVFLPMI